MAVGSGVLVAVGIGVLVVVGIGVIVGPNICPEPQPEASVLSNKTQTTITFEFVFITLLWLSRAHPAPAKARAYRWSKSGLPNGKHYRQVRELAEKATRRRIRRWDRVPESVGEIPHLSGACDVSLLSRLDVCSRLVQNFDFTVDAVTQLSFSNFEFIANL